MKKKIKIQKLRAVTLMEVVVAMALLGLVVTLTVSVTSPLIGENKSILHVKGLTFLDKVISETKAQKNYLDRTETWEDFEVKMVFTDYQNEQNLVVGDFSLNHKNNSDVLFQQKIILENPQLAKTEK